MRYKKMIVWSAGDEKAKSSKFETIGFSTCAIMFIFLIVLFFTTNFNEDISVKMELIDHIITGVCFTVLTWWIPLGLIIMAKDSHIMTKENKQIPLYLYDIEDFIKIGNIPEGQFVLFSNEKGAVLALEKYEIESRYFARGAKYFHEFTEYYEKSTQEKEEIILT